MPHVNIKLFPGRSHDQKMELTKRIVKAMEETIGAPPDSVSVVFEEVDPADWDEKVVKPEIARKKDLLFKPPGYKSRYFNP